jgi:hypothetical protein
MHDVTIEDATGVSAPANAPVPGITTPCPRTIRVDGGLDADGACYGCGACLFAVLAEWN